MKSKCCYADTIKGGVLNGEQVYICLKCKKAQKDESNENLKSELAMLKNAYRDVVKKNVALRNEIEEMKKYVVKLEKFSKSI